MKATNCVRAVILSGAVAATGLLQLACTHSDYGNQQGYSAAPPNAAPAPTYAPAYAAPAPVYAPANAAPVYQPLNQAQLDQLTGPIALYADPLLAQLLPAATYPGDIQAAAAWLAANPQTTEDAINAQPWDGSVKAIVHYPTVLKMMNDRLDWTQALGVAFYNQQPDVMASIQRLRLQAQAAGSLQTTPQQEVILVDNYVRVLPVQPTVIYVPVYDPQVVYVVRRPWYQPQPVISFGIGFGVGTWLSNDTDWHDHRVMERGDWRRDVRSERERSGARVTNNITVNKTTTIVNNNTTVNVGQTGGSAWTRNTAKPQPVMPATVAKQLGVAPQPTRTAAPAPTRAPDNRTNGARTNAPRPVNVAPTTPPAPPAVEPSRVAPVPTPPAVEPPKRTSAPRPPAVEPPKRRPAPTPPAVEPPKRGPAPVPPAVEPPKRTPAPVPPAVEPPKRTPVPPAVEPPKRTPAPVPPAVEPPKRGPAPTPPTVEPPKHAPPPAAPPAPSEPPRVEPRRPGPPAEPPKADPPAKDPKDPKDKDKENK